MPRFNHRPGRGATTSGDSAPSSGTRGQLYGPHEGSDRIPGFGASLKTQIKRRHPAWFEIHPFGEVLPYARNRITVDPARVDRYGVPLLHIDYQIGDNERKMTEHMADTIEEIVKAAGGELVNYKRGALDAMGSAIHEHGTCRMGADPKRSALNRVQPDARGEERVRRGRVRVPDGDGEEPHADDSRALVARDRLSRRGDETRHALRLA